MDGNLHPGYVVNWNATAEYQFGANNLVKLMYQGSAGVHLVESWNVNVFPTNFGADNPTLQNAAFAAPQNYLPYTQFGNINYMSNTGHSSYHAGTVQFQKRYSQGLVLNSFYTYSKAMDDCDSDSGTCSGVAPIQNRNLNKGRAGYDRTHVIVANFTYELPVGKGRHFLNKSRALDLLLGGYELAWIQTYETGNPIGFSFTNSPYNYYPTSIGNRVPDLTCSGISMPGFGLGSLIGGARFNQALENPVLPVNCFAAPARVYPRQCRTQHRDRTGTGVLAGIAQEEFRLQGALEPAAPLRFPEPVPQLGLQCAEQPGGLQESPAVRKDHRGPDHGILRRRAADEPDVAFELVGQASWPVHFRSKHLSCEMDLPWAMCETESVRRFILAQRPFLPILQPCAARAGQPFAPADWWNWRDIDSPRINADGTAVVYVDHWNQRDADRACANLWTVSAAGGTPRRLTDGPWRDTLPAWSPDGASLAFLSDRDGTTQIWVRRAGFRRRSAGHAA